MTTKFRQNFVLQKNFKVNWYPGHMAKTYRLLPENLKKVDVFLEVRDSRIPISSGNSELNQMIPSNVKRYILFNKFDLCDQKKTRKIIENCFQGSNITCEVLTAKSDINVKKILELIQKDHVIKFKTVGLWCMICGIPNVGKSTLINTFKSLNSELREESAKTAKTAPLPTTTRLIDYFKVSNSPVIYLMDSPGIMPPKITNNENGFKMSICGSIKDKIIGKELLCDYLLFVMNKNNYLQYSKLLKIEPTNDIHTVLSNVQKNFGCSNQHMAMDFFLKLFREGRIGKVTIDEDIGKSVVCRSFID